MASYNDMARTVLDFYTNPDQLVQYGGWEKIFDPNNTYSLEQAYEAIRNNPNIQIIEREDGTVIGWWNKSTGSSSLVNDVGSLPNSNTAGGSVTSTALTNIYNSPQITKVSDNSFKLANAPAVGEKWATNGGVTGALMVVASGLKLGLTIDKALYDLHPDIFTDEQLESLNPENWKKIGSFVNEQWTEMGYPTIGKIGQMVFDTITYVGQDGYSQQYIDEDAFTYAAQYLQKQGMFTSEETVDFSDVNKSVLTYPNIYISIPVSTTGASFTWYPTYPPYVDHTTYDIISSEDTVFFFNVPYATTRSNYVDAYAVSKKPFSVKKSDTQNILVARKTKIHGIQCYWLDYLTWGFGESDIVPNRAVLTKLGMSGSEVDRLEMGYDCGYLVISGKLAPGKPDGVSYQSDANLPDFSTATDFNSFKNLLKQQYPDMWNGAVTRDVLQPDGTLKTFTYVPVPTPNTKGWTDTQPTGDGSQQSQKDTVVKPDMNTSIKDSISSSTSTGSTTPNPPGTGGGDSPTVVPPVGKASSLWSIYNPTLEQVNQFGSWLWSSNFVEQLKKLFSDPMQAIIGLHKVYSPVQTSGQGTIKCGYLDSAVPSKLVSEQYTTVDCGSVDLQEYFGNVFDYPPYTEVSIYLPFIGIRQLDPSDVMRSTISVKYHIDVLTGACLAEVNVQRDAAGGTLYTFSGDAAVRYPVSSGSYMGIVSGLIGVATSIVSGNLLPALGGATRLRTNVDRSGSFTGNSGAMGSKVPYLIISRPQTAMADKFETLSGYPSNIYTPLSACKGFTQVKYCHVENLNATDAEKQEIERLLKEGVIL